MHTVMGDDASISPGDLYENSTLWYDRAQIF